MKESDEELLISERETLFENDVFLIAKFVSKDGFLSLKQPSMKDFHRILFEGIF